MVCYTLPDISTNLRKATIFEIAFMSLFMFCQCTAIDRASSAEHERTQWMPEAMTGDARAQYRVAETFANTKQAQKWYCLSALQGYVPAQAALGDLYSGKRRTFEQEQNARPVPDFVAAYMWYTVAAASGHDGAFNRRQTLGNMMAPDDVVAAKKNAARWTQQRCN